MTYKARRRSTNRYNNRSYCDAAAAGGGAGDAVVRGIVPLLLSKGRTATITLFSAFIFALVFLYTRLRVSCAIHRVVAHTSNKYYSILYYGYATVTTTIRFRFDGRSTAIRLFIKGH